MNRLGISLLIVIQVAFSNFTAADPISGKTLFRNPEAYSFILSPNSKYVAGHFNYDDEMVVVLYDLKTEKSYALFSLDMKTGINISSLKWIDTNSLYVRLRFKFGNDRVGLVQIGFSGEVLKPQYKTIKTDGYIVDPMPSVEGKVLYAKNVGRDKKRYKLYVVTEEQLINADFATAVEIDNTLTDADYYYPGFLTGEMIASTTDGDVRSYWHLSGQTKRWAKFWSSDNVEHRFVPVGMLNADTMAVLSNVNSDLVSLYEFNLKNNTFGKLLYQQPRYDILNAETDPVRKAINYVTFVDHGRIVTKYFTDKDQKNHRLLQKAFPGKQVHVVSSNDSTEHKIIFVFGSDDPGCFYYFNTKTLIARILAPRNPELEHYKLAKSDVFSNDVESGQKIESILTRPRGDSNGVLIVMPHGGPIGIRDYDFYSPEVQYLASRGYSILSVNFRGSSGFGKRFQKTGVGQFGKIIEQDITRAVGHVSEKYDFKYKCTMGTSYGGYSAVMLAIEHPLDYQCIIGMFGVYDLPLLFNASNLKLQEDYQKRISRVVGELDDSLKDVSPFYLADRIKAPLLLIAGDQDPIADIEQTNRLKYRLQQRGAKLEHLFYKGSGHGLQTWYGERHLYAYIDDFIRRHLRLNNPSGDNESSIREEESLIIADEFYSGNRIDKDNSLALRYYKKAAGYGNARAIFNVGHFYRDGHVVKSDPEMALDWYRKASDAGYSGASYYLGQIYATGKMSTHTLQADPELSYSFYQLADKQKHVYAIFNIAKALCTGSGVSKDIARCLTLLTISDPESDKGDFDDKKFHRNSIAVEILTSDGYTPEEMEKIKAFFNTELGVSTFDDKIKVVRSHPFKSILDGNVTIVTRSSIPAVRGARFGDNIMFTTEESDGKITKALVKQVWTTPAKNQDGTLITETKYRFIKLNMLQELSYRLDYDWERVEGVWKVEVFSLDDELIFEDRFKTRLK
ncbi:MAG: prolyl oligopeptidase family serine peptidase [Exilibacterium sp.]